jgi:hypothetical protein
LPGAGSTGSEFSVSEPPVLATFTIRVSGASRSSGSVAWVTATTPNTFVSKTARSSSSETALSRPDFDRSSRNRLGSPACETPALLTSTSSRPASSRISSAADGLTAADILQNLRATPRCAKSGPSRGDRRGRHRAS